MNDWFCTFFDMALLYIRYLILYRKQIILYRIYSILTSKYQIKTFPKNQPSNLGCYFYKKEAFLELVIFHCSSSPNPYTSTRMCVSTTGSLSLSHKKVNTHCKSQVRSWFFGFSLIFDFSVCFNYL